MASDFRNKYRLRLDDGSSRDMWYAGDISIFRQFIDYKARRNQWLEGIAPKTESEANWTNPFSRSGRDAFFQAQRVKGVRQVDSVRGVIDKRDREFYRTVRIGKFLIDGKLYELEWFAEDLRYVGKNKRAPLGIPAPNGGGRLYTIDELSRWTSENDPDSLRVGFGNLPIIADSVASDEAIAEASQDLPRERQIAELALLNFGNAERIIVMHAAIASPDDVNTEDIQTVGNSLLSAISPLDTQIATERAIGTLAQTQSDINRILPANAGASKLLMHEFGLALDPNMPYSNPLYRALMALNSVLYEVENDYYSPNAISVPNGLGQRIQYLGQISNWSFNHANTLAEKIILNADIHDADFASYAEELSIAIDALVAGLDIKGDTTKSELNYMKTSVEAAHVRAQARQAEMHDYVMLPLESAMKQLEGLEVLEDAIGVLGLTMQELNNPEWDAAIGIHTARQVVEAERQRLIALVGQGSAANPGAAAGSSGGSTINPIEIHRTRETLEASRKELNIAYESLDAAVVSLDQLAYDLLSLAKLIPANAVPPAPGGTLAYAIDGLNGDIEELNGSIGGFIGVLGEKIKDVTDPKYLNEVIQGLKMALTQLSTALSAVKVDTANLNAAISELDKVTILSMAGIDNVVAAVIETKVPDINPIALNDLYYVFMALIGNNYNINISLPLLIERLSNLRQRYADLAALKTKRYYAPERGWRIPRNSDITWLQVFTRGFIMSDTIVEKPPKLMPYTDYTRFQNWAHANNTELAKLLSENWPYVQYSTADEKYHTQVWGNPGRLGFDATVHTANYAQRRYDAYTLLKVDEAESRGVECTFGSFYVQTYPNSRSTILVSGTIVGTKRCALRLVRTVPVGEG